MARSKGETAIMAEIKRIHEACLRDYGRIPEPAKVPKEREGDFKGLGACVDDLISQFEIGGDLEWLVNYAEPLKDDLDLLVMPKRVKWPNFVKAALFLFFRFRDSSLDILKSEMGKLLLATDSYRGQRYSDCRSYDDLIFSGDLRL